MVYPISGQSPSVTPGGRLNSKTGHGMSEPDYLRMILNAQVYDVAVETPLDDAPALSRRLGNFGDLKI